MKDRKGTNMVGSVTAIVTVMIVISIGVILADELMTSQYSSFGINTSDPTQAISSVDLQGGFNTTRDMAAAGFGIVPVVIIIMAAIPVLGAVFLLGR